MLTPHQIQQFDEQGFLLGGKVLDDDQVETLRNEMKRVIDEKDKPGVPQPVLLRNLSGDPSRPVWQIVNIWMASEPFSQLMRTPTILEEIAQLTRAQQLRIWHDQVQYKPAETGGVNMWHQDSPLWPTLEPKTEQVTAWVALDDVDESNGCMSMVVGSHKWGNKIEHFGSFKGWNGLPSEFEGHKIETRLCPVKKGHVHYHHGLTWHGSHANTSGRPRRAIALHYMTQKTVYNASKDHPCKHLITVADGQMIAGDNFPLLWEKKQQAVAV